MLVVNCECCSFCSACWRWCIWILFLQSVLHGRNCCAPQKTAKTEMASHFVFANLWWENGVLLWCFRCALFKNAGKTLQPKSLLLLSCTFSVREDQIRTNVHKILQRKSHLLFDLHKCAHGWGPDPDQKPGPPGPVHSVCPHASKMCTTVRVKYLLKPKKIT